MAGTYTAYLTMRPTTGATAVSASAIPDVNIEPLRWVLNETGRTGFRMSKASSVYSALDLLDKEVQIFRDSDLMWCGPLVLGDTDSSTPEMRVDVPDLSWYFSRRQLSDARANLVTNPSFEGSPDLTGWTNTGDSTPTASTTRAVLGTKSLKLVQTAPGVDTFQYQQFAQDGGSIGTLVTVAAWVYIDNTSWGGPAYESRGLFLSGIESSVVRTTSNAEIDDATPRGRWVRLETTIWVPPNESWTIEVRLYAPDADVWWDAVQAVRMESLSHYATDMGTIAGNIVDFIQNPTHGWDDLGITTSDVASGVLLDRHYQYADHIDAAQALAELEAMGLDWSIEIDDSPLLRQFTTAYPKGTDRSGTVTFSMRSAANPTGNLSRYRLTKDGGATATRITVLGEGDGPDREEGYARDTSSLGGVTLGDVITAPAGAPINALQAIADEHLSVSKRLVRILEVTGLPGNSTQITTCVVGDTVDVNIVDQGESITGDWRIVAKTLDPKMDLPSFVLNEVA